MKVFFTASAEVLDTSKDTYLEIVKAIKGSGNTIVGEWLDDAIRNMSRPPEVFPGDVIYEEIIQAILSSDAMVVEGSFLSYSIGYQVSIALARSKPVLVLRQSDVKRESNKVTSDFIDSIKNSLLTVVYYKPEDLTETVNEYLEKVSGGSTVKFNIVLSKQIESYLDWASYTHKVNKSEHIRNIIQDYMDNRDVKYRKFIGGENPS